jgi:hypothetical protein
MEAFYGSLTPLAKFGSKLAKAWPLKLRIVDYISVSQTMYRGTKLCQKEIANVPKTSTRKGVMSNFFTFELAKMSGHKTVSKICF